MCKTVVEKIMSRKSGMDCRAGNFVVCEVDALMGTDGSVPLALEYFEQLKGTSVHNPEQVAFFADHYAPAPNQKVAEIHRSMSEFCERFGCAYYKAGDGIGNQIMVERGYVRPGSFVLGADSHSCMFGALNALSFGIGSSDLATLLVYGKTWFRVPSTIRVELTGQVPPYVSAKDIGLDIVGIVKQEGANYQTIEFHGDVIKQLSMESRFVISNLVTDLGAKGGIMPVDSVTLDWLSEQGIDSGSPVEPDEGATYARTISVDVSQTSPRVAVPHQVDSVVPVEEVAGTKVDMVFIGTCTNGRIEDYRAVAEVLKDHDLAQGVQLLIIPASRDVMRQAMDEGLLQLFASKGATIGTPGCGPCCGTGNGVPGDGMTVLSTANRNFRGRMGNPNASVYLASPLTAAVSAVRGFITHPKEMLG